MGLWGEGLGGGRVLREKRRCRHLVTVTVFPGFASPGGKAMSQKLVK